jgi:hypothetical protein
MVRGPVCFRTDDFVDGISNPRGSIGTYGTAHITAQTTSVGLALRAGRGTPNQRSNE